jgi:lipopolysaccharide export system permease protein
VAISGSLCVFERYLAREIYVTTALVLAAFLALFSFFDLVHELSSIGRGGYQFHHAFGYVLLTLPGRAYELFPIAVLIGTLYALTLLARHSEITVLRASGLSTARMLLALGKIGAVFVILTFLLGEFVAPPAERMAQQLRLRAMSSVVAQEFRSGLWVKDEHAFVNVREVLPDSTLRDVRIYEFDASHQLRSISEAATGTYQPPDHWLLDVAQGKLSELGRLATLRRDLQLPCSHGQGLTPSVPVPDEIHGEAKKYVHPYEMSRHENIGGHCEQE